MKDIVIYLDVPPYLRDYLVHSFGFPVSLPHRSYENILLSSLLKPKSHRRRHLSDDATGLPVVIPKRSDKKPSVYNYLSDDGRLRVTRALKNIFKMHLWSDVFPLVNSHAPLNESIDQWCKSQGIAVEHREAVRQCFFRLRRNHEDYGIVLGKKYVKSDPI